MPLSSGISLGYNYMNSQGGCAGVWLGSWNDTAMTFNFASDGITIATFSGTTVSFFKFEQEPEKASLNWTSTKENGNTVYETTFEFEVKGLTAGAIEKLHVLETERWRVIVKSENDKWFFLGYKHPVKVETTAGGLGGTMNDLVGARVTMKVRTNRPFYEMAQYAATQVITN